jgi:hypothetical protein
MDDERKRTLYRRFLIGEVVGLLATLILIADGIASDRLWPVAGFLALGIGSSAYMSLAKRALRRRAYALRSAPVPRGVRLTKPVWIRVDELLTFVALLAPLGAVLAAFGFPGVGVGIMLVPCGFSVFSDFFPFMNAGGLVFEETGLRLSVARAEYLVPWTSITRVEVSGPESFQMVELDFEALDRVVASVTPDTPRNRKRARELLDRPGEAGGHLLLGPWSGGLDGQTLERAIRDAMAGRPDQAN